MKYKEAIEHTKNKQGTKQSVSGLMINTAEILESNGEDKDGKDYGAGYAFSLKQMSEHYNQARESWLNGDLETVAEFFGLYI